MRKGLPQGSPASDDNPLHPGSSFFFFLPDFLLVEIITGRELGGIPLRSMSGLAGEEKSS